MISIPVLDGDDDDNNGRVCVCVCVCVCVFNPGNGSRLAISGACIGNVDI